MHRAAREHLSILVPAAAVCAVVTVGCRDTVSRVAPAPAPAGPATASTPSASAAASAQSALTIDAGGCWGAASDTPDALLVRAEARCAPGMSKVAGPRDLVGAVKLGGQGPACYRVALVGEGRVTATLADGETVVERATGDGAVLLPRRGPLCVAGEVTLTSTSERSVRFIAWRGRP